MSGLGALAANYTDSEDEELNRDESENVDDENTRESMVLVGKSATGTPASQTSARSTPLQKKEPAKVVNLVSYVDPDEVEENVENDKDDANAEPVPMELESDEDHTQRDDDDATDQDLNPSLNRSASHIEVESWTDGGKLPPEPPGFCDEQIQEKVNRVMKKKEQGFDMNYVIQSKKNFRNPSIYEKLIEHVDIDEFGTNFPKELYDGHLFGPESYYDVLAKDQRADMDRRAAKAEKAKLPVTIGNLINK